MNNKGFTLIELLIVITIIGILTTLTTLAVIDSKNIVACSEGDSIQCDKLEITKQEAIDMIDSDKSDKFTDCDIEAVDCKIDCINWSSINDCDYKCNLKKQKCELIK